MDRWEPFANSVRTPLADADDKIVFDRFHLMGYLGRAVDTVRKQENRALMAEGDKPCAGSKCLWPYSQENLPDRHRGRFASLRGMDPKTARAWAIKETMRHSWEYRRRGWAERHWKSWYFWATHSSLQPVVDAARTLERHEAGLFSYFARPVTNAGAEGLDSRIQAIRVHAAAIATESTSRPPSTSISAAWPSTLKPTEFPEEPDSEGLQRFRTRPNCFT